MPAPSYRKRRPNAGPNKNELKISRGEAVIRDRERAGTLRQRFPDVQKLDLKYRMLTPEDAVLEDSRKTWGLDDPLQLDIPCQGGCGNGVFLVTEAAIALLSSPRDHHEGLAVCQGTSYKDARLPCGTRLFYKLDVTR
jgi:hypothetical protein